jgi:glycosyltransferase involved in cell wall biosynthesis
VTDGRLTVLQISTYEHRGGAERVAHDLFAAFRRLGHRSYLVAGRGPAGDPDVMTLDDHHGPSHVLAGAGRLLDRWRGTETYRYPASHGIVPLLPHEPDIVHAHNLHGGYFDLRLLPALSRRIPTLLTLHDAWLLSGHCAHSFDCERWRTGCGECPDLSIYPAIRRDGTAANWRRKRDIFGGSTLHIATPSEWLMERVRASMLAPAARTMHVIPNGVDLELFAPGE